MPSFFCEMKDTKSGQKNFIIFKIRKREVRK